MSQSPILVTGAAGRIGGVGGAVVDILRGKGLPEVNRAHSRGDQHVVIQVATPTRLNDRQRKALMEFAAGGEEVGETEEASLFEKVRNIFGGRPREKGA